jgi:hypothetical protein
VADHQCIDCRKEDPDGTRWRIRKLDTERPARCYTHQRRFLTRQRQQARGRSVERTYDISAADNGALLVFQNGRCWICRKATGASKLLATDHDHADDWVRGRLCSTCNQFIGRQLGDDPNAAARLVGYLSGDTPYRRMLAERLIRANNPDAEIAHLSVVHYGDSDVIDIRFQSGAHYNQLTTTLTTLQTYATPKS